MNPVTFNTDKGAKAENGRAVHHPVAAPVKDVPRDELIVRCVKSLEEIESLEEPWRKLTAKNSAPFQTFIWNLAWYRHFHEEYDEALVFVVERENEAVAILPAFRKGRVVRLAADDQADYQDMLTTSQDVGCPSLVAIFNSLEEELHGCRFLFKKIANGGFIHHFFSEDSCREESGITFIRPFAPCPYVSIEGGLDDYLAALPSKRRQDMKRSLRRFDQEMPRARLEMIRSLEIRVADLETIAEFHATYFRKEGTSPLSNPALIGMLGEIAKNQDVGLQLGALVDQGELLAIDIGFARGGRYYGYLTGFHPDFQKFAPGKCLLLKRIDAWVKEDGIKVLDFLSGDESYKTGFTHGDSYEVQTIHWMPNRMPNRARRATLVAKKFGERVAKEAISKLALPR